MKEESIEAEGVVVGVKRNAFDVQIENGHTVLCTLGGKMRKHFIRVIEGDSVTIEISPYDLNRGRITYRHKE